VDKVTKQAKLAENMAEEVGNNWGPGMEVAESYTEGVES